MEYMCPTHLDKENKGRSPPSTLNITPDIHLLASPPEYVCAPVQLPSASPSAQDPWQLPGRLRINPSLWNKEDVAHWLHWAQKEYSLRRPERGCFEMNGRALCLLTKEDFRRRCPGSGDVLYEILQGVKQHRRGVVCSPANTPLHAPTQATGSQRPLIPQKPNHDTQHPKAPTTNRPEVSDTLSSAVSVAPLTSMTSHPGLMAPIREQSTFFNKQAAPYTCTTQCPSEYHNIKVEPLNLSSRERPRSPTCEGRLPECRLLWDYVYQLLCDSRYDAYIRWEDRERLVFKVVDPNGLARLWGNHKSRANMTYEKMSRALRHYYKLNIIKKEPGQKLLFRFLKTPQDIRTQKNDLTDSPETTPRQDCSYTGSSLSHENNAYHFAVSNEPASPQADELLGI